MKHFIEISQSSTCPLSDGDMRFFMRVIQAVVDDITYGGNMIRSNFNQPDTSSVDIFADTPKS